MPLTRQDLDLPEVRPCSAADTEVYAGSNGRMLLRCRNCTLDLLETEIIVTGKKKKRHLRVAVHINLRLSPQEEWDLGYPRNAYVFGRNVLFLTLRTHTGIPLDISFGYALYERLVPFAWL
jgi:hypothetical protein